MTETVYVTNNGEKALTDSWDGVFYTFEPGKTLEVPAFVAGHIFGYGFEDKTDHVIRLGWAKTTNELPGALCNLQNFVITTEPPVIQAAPAFPRVALDSPPPSLPVRGRGRRGDAEPISLQ